MSLSLIYSDNDAFYEKLDNAIKEGKVVSIVFKDEKLTTTSGIWRRLKNTQNFNQIEDELRELGRTKKSSIFSDKFLDSHSFGIANGVMATPVLIFLATLIAGAFMYAIYKNRKIAIKIGTPPIIVIEAP